MRRLSRLAVGLVLLAACSDDSRSPLEPDPSLSQGSSGVRVTTKADAGPGSFRAAIRQANADPSIGSIRFDRNLGPIKLLQPVVYTGAQSLKILGNGARLDGSGLPAGGSAFEADGGGDLTIQELTVLKAPGNGITIKVPDAALGIFKVRLNGVVILENGLHGILINDQAEYFENPASTSEEGSASSLLVEVWGDSRFLRNGFALIDSDGLRINEGGEGTLEAHIRDTRFNDNGADGLELDERAAGSAEFSLRGTTLNGNGSFTTEDLDDGIDVDEGGDGDLIGSFRDVIVNRNFEQGVDLNENDVGNLRVFMADVRAVGNNEEGIEFEEDDDVEGGGDIEAELRRITVRENGAAGGDAGLKLREKGEGSMFAQLASILATDNPIAGILVQEDEAGDLNADLVEASARRNGDDGIQFNENEDGNLSGRIRRSTSSNNGGAGADLEQEAPGTGEVALVQFTAVGNTDGPVATDGVTTGP